MLFTSFKNHWARQTSQPMPNTDPALDLEFLDWGLIDYEIALEKQLELVQKLQTYPENKSGYLVFCSHPEVVTTGRQTKPEDIFSWSGKVIEISRGGRATYHGPSQIVIYPILNLKNPRKHRGPQEIRGYIRDLEAALIRTLKHFDISAEGRSLQQKPNNQDLAEETGVWVHNRKVASIGIAVKKWICFHGVALNLEQDPKAFLGLNPCGFKSSTMISVEEILGQKPDLQKFKNILKTHLIEIL